MPLNKQLEHAACCEWTLLLHASKLLFVSYAVSLWEQLGCGSVTVLTIKLALSSMHVSALNAFDNPAEKCPVSLFDTCRLPSTLLRAMGPSLWPLLETTV